MPYSRATQAAREVLSYWIDPYVKIVPRNDGKNEKIVVGDRFEANFRSDCVRRAIPDITPSPKQRRICHRSQ